MAISDAYVLVSCDHTYCPETVEVPLPFTYGGIMHTEGHYDHDKRAIERRIQRDGWTVRDDKHFCSPSCAGDDEPSP